MAQPTSGWKPDFEDHELGVHINLKHASYLKDSGLGYGALVDLLASAVEWWDASAWNPLAPAEPRKKAFLYGEAAHVYFLEGQKAYDKIFGLEPTKSFFPDFLSGGAELREACQARGLGASGSIAEMEARLKRFDPDIKLLADLVQQFRETGKRAIPFDVHARIQRLYRMATRSAMDLDLGHGEIMTLEEALKGGLSEVSIFWVDTDGVRHRARFDYLKPNTTIDLKTITEWRKSDFRKSLLKECVLRGYVVQAVQYDEARRQLRLAVDEGRVFGGNKTQRKLLERIARAEEWAWTWIFAKMDGAPQVKGIVLDKEGGQYKKAIQQRETAIAKFVFHREQFGMERPWFDTEIVWQPAEDDWDPYSVLYEE